MNVRTLVLMRHAKSSWDTAAADHERPLNDRGEKAAPRMGRWIAGQGLQPDLILCSTATRAHRTAQLVAVSFDQPVEVRATKKLYLPLPEDILEVVACEGGDAETILVVAHNPGVSVAVEQFAGVATVMPTAAAAVVDFSVDDWSDLLVEANGSMREFCRVKELVG